MTPMALRARIRTLEARRDDERGIQVFLPDNKRGDNPQRDGRGIRLYSPWDPDLPPGAVKLTWGDAPVPSAEGRELLRVLERATRV